MCLIIIKIYKWKLKNQNLPVQSLRNLPHLGQADPNNSVIKSMKMRINQNKELAQFTNPSETLSIQSLESLTSGIILNKVITEKHLLPKVVLGGNLSRSR